MKSILKYERDFYDRWVMDNIQPLSEKEMRSEYKRLRKIIKKRLDVLKKYGESPDVRKKFYRLVREPESKLNLKSIKTRLQEFAYFDTLKGGSHTELQRIRKESIKTLKEHGYKFVSEKNFDNFAKYMELMKSTLIGKLLSSNQIAESFDDFVDNGKLSPSELEKAYEKFYFSKLENVDFESRKIPRINTQEFKKFVNRL